MTDSNTESSAPTERYHSITDGITYDFTPDGLVITFPDGTTNTLFGKSGLPTVGCVPSPEASIPSNFGAIHATPDGRITQAVNPAPEVSIPSDCVTSGHLTTVYPIWEGYVPHEPPADDKPQEGPVGWYFYDGHAHAKPQTAPEELQDSPELTAFFDSFRQKGGAADGK